MKVHLCNWASQPDIQIWCDESWTTPAWPEAKRKNPGPFPAGVHLADSGKLYAFDRDKTTCEVCLRKTEGGVGHE